MASFIPCKKNDAGGFIFYVGLVSQANPNTLQTNPTIAAGDFKVSIDGGALANPGTLPAVTPAASKMVKITLAQAEINGDNITVVCSDAAGAEWCDQIINIQTAARFLDDHCFPTTSGRSLDVTATGAAGIDWANVENPTTALNLSATNIDVDQVVASVSGAVGSVAGAVGSVTGAVGSVTGAVGSVTGAVGSVTGAVGSVAGAVGSVTAGVTIAAGGIISGAHAAAELNTMADATLDRVMSAGVDSGGDNTTARTVRQSLRVLRNKYAVAAGTGTCFKEDDVTASFTAAITTTAGNPVSEVDPT